MNESRSQWVSIVAAALVGLLVGGALMAFGPDASEGGEELTTVAAEEQEDFTPDAREEARGVAADVTVPRVLQRRSRPLRWVVHADLDLTRIDGTVLERAADRGEIIAVDSRGLTIERPDGVQVSFLIEYDTIVREGLAPGEIADLAVGDGAAVFSRAGEDGSLVAVAVRGFEWHGD